MSARRKKKSPKPPREKTRDSGKDEETAQLKSSGMEEGSGKDEREEPIQSVPAEAKPEKEKQPETADRIPAGEAPGGETRKGKQSGKKRLWEKLKNFILRLWRFPRKLLERIRRIRLTIRRICDKIKKWKDFLTWETTRKALRFLLGRGRALLRHILPRKVKGNVTVGCEDPSLTGQLMAAAGVLYPLYKDNIRITPVFDRQILEGDLMVRGRIFGVMFLWTIWKIYRNQDVRRTWSRFRNKEA